MAGLWDAYQAAGVPLRVTGSLVRCGISAEMIPALTDEELRRVRNLGANGLTTLRRLFPYTGERARGHANTDDLTPEQWEILAEVAEREGYGDMRQSQLLALVKDGILPVPVPR